MTDEVLEKEMNQIDKIDQSVDETITSMGYIWKETLDKFSTDGICFLCKEKLGENKYSIVKGPSDKVEPGMIAFVCICKTCNGCE